MRVPYKPHEKQQVIHKALRPFCQGNLVMVVAGRRAGKTVLSVNEIVKRAIEVPGSRIWYVAPTKEQAYGIAWRLMLYDRYDNKGKKLPPYMPKEMIKKQREDRHSVELTNGSLIEFKGTTDEIHLLGVGLHFAVLDEFPTIPYSVWYDTIRPTLVDVNGDALFIGTVPDPKVHDITTEFLDMYENIFYRGGEEGERAFNFESTVNPYINHQKIEKDINRLKQQGREEDAERLYRGKYSRVHGLVFKKFDFDEHTLDPVPVPTKAIRIFAIDPHPQKPYYGLWCAIDPLTRFWFYREREFIHPNGDPMTIREIAYEIYHVEDENNDNVRVRVIDPTFANVKLNIEDTNPQSVAQIFRSYGLGFREADRAFITFYNEFTDRLIDDPPSIRIFRSCIRFIQQIQSYTWDTFSNTKARAEKGAKDRPKKKNDDLIDCAKYIFNANITPPDFEQMKRFRAKKEAEWRDRKFL